MQIKTEQIDVPNIKSNLPADASLPDQVCRESKALDCNFQYGIQMPSAPPEIVPSGSTERYASRQYSIGSGESIKTQKDVSTFRTVRQLLGAKQAKTSGSYSDTCGNRSLSKQGGPQLQIDANKFETFKVVNKAGKLGLVEVKSTVKSGTAEQPQYKCKICECTFYTEGTFRNHVLQAHSVWDPTYHM